MIIHLAVVRLVRPGFGVERSEALLGQHRIIPAIPSIKNIPGPYRLFFYSFDCNEPVHVHVQREKMICKFWLEPVELARNHGFPGRELSRIRQLIQSNLTRFMEDCKIQ